MAKIRINDLPKDVKVSKDEMKKVFGGVPYNAPIGAAPAGQLGAQVATQDPTDVIRGMLMAKPTPLL